MKTINRIDSLLRELQKNGEKIINVEDSLIKDINELESEKLITQEQKDCDNYVVKLSLKGEMFIEEGGYEDVFHKKDKERIYNRIILVCYIVTALGGIVTALITVFKR